MQLQQAPRAMPGMPLLLPPGLKLLAGWLLVCTAGALLVSLAWWAALRAQGTGLDASEMVIAPGTAEAIANGYPVSQPSEIKLRRGGTLTVVNRDDVTHFVAWASIAPGETTTLQIPPGEGALKFDCSTHPSGSLLFDVSSRLPLWQAVAGALAAGIVMGTVLAGVTALTRSLDTN
ncbi:hypothetical protein [Candidatus Amarobacter glycogenicus]|uniref:hypothetical protein n=2 Tax=Candidatus Amarobacter glycogenicus TaxID=3140699 RepID=UPI003136AB03|nr:hypothetical protein [Dehalococcoidia bacterium]